MICCRWPRELAVKCSVRWSPMTAAHMYTCVKCSVHDLLQVAMLQCQVLAVKCSVR